MKKKIISIILIMLILQYFCTFVFADNSLTNEVLNEVTNSITDELKNKQEEVESKIDEANTELEYVQGELSDTMLRVQKTQDKILQYQKEFAIGVDLYSKKLEEENK